MVRLSLQLARRGGREGLLGLLITATAVAVGVALLLGVLAEFHAVQANASRPGRTQRGRRPGHLHRAHAGAFGVITLTLPLLRTMTAPSTIRFE